jgi:hypothetical protein
MGQSKRRGGLWERKGKRKEKGEKERKENKKQRKVKGRKNKLGMFQLENYGRKTKVSSIKLV